MPLTHATRCSTSPPSRTPAFTLWLLAGLFAAAILSHSPARAQGAASTLAASGRLVQPDVQVLIMDAGSDAEMIDLTYPKVVPAAQAQRDSAAVMQAAGLPMSAVEITNSALPMAGIKAVPMTSATFATRGAMSAKDTTLRLEPWIVGLRGYSNLAITYMTPPNFTFNGLRQYQDRYVSVTLDQRGQSFTYHVRVLDGRFGKLNLPLMQPDPRAVQVAQDEQKRLVRFRIVGLVALTALAAAVGYAVYALLSR